MIANKSAARAGFELVTVASVLRTWATPSQRRLNPDFETSNSLFQSLSGLAIKEQLYFCSHKKANQPTNPRPQGYRKKYEAGRYM